VQCWLYSGVVWGRFGAMLAGARHIIVTHRGTGLIRIGVLRLIERLTGHRYTIWPTAGPAPGLSPNNWEWQPEVHVVHNGIDASRYQVPSDRAALLGELGLPDDRNWWSP